MARGEDLGEVAAFREGVLLLDPLWDLLHLVGQAIDQSVALVRAKIGGTESAGGPFQRESVGQLLRAYKSDYLSNADRVTSPFGRGFLSDPFPPLVRICRTVAEALARRTS